MTRFETTIAENLERVRSRIAAAAARAGRSADSVRLIAVTKYADDAWVEALSGMHYVFGESRPQQLMRRVPAFAASIEWHLIGQLQRNKVRATLPLCALIHSVDSLRLLDRISTVAGELNLTPKLLLEVNITNEESKAGFGVDDLRSHWSEITSRPNVSIAGLMTMARRSSDPQESRPAFQSLRALRDELSGLDDASELSELSMGMSGDFEVAIEEGATLVRVGSALFTGLDSGAAH